MGLERLLADGLIEAFEPTPELVKQALESSEKDLKTARAVFGTGDCDWTLAIAYNSMLQAGRALMFHSGYRPKGEHKHLAVVKFVAEKLGGKSSALVALFNKARVRRHTVVYEARETVSKGEAERVIAYAEELLSVVHGEIGKKK